MKLVWEKIVQLSEWVSSAYHYIIPGISGLVCVSTYRTIPPLPPLFVYIRASSQLFLPLSLGDDRGVVILIYVCAFPAIIRSRVAPEEPDMILVCCTCASFRLKSTIYRIGLQR